MNLSEWLQLIPVLSSSGVSHFKSEDVEISFFGNAPVQPLSQPVAEMASHPATGPESAASAPPVELNIPHHANEVKELLGLNDEALVDRLFPVHGIPDEKITIPYGEP